MVTAVDNKKFGQNWDLRVMGSVEFTLMQEQGRLPSVPGECLSRRRHIKLQLWAGDDSQLLSVCRKLLSFNASQE